MQLNLSQQMKMTQQMRLAPRMIQSMEILQLPIMALQERIEQELEENVVLEAVADTKESSDTEREVELERAKEESASAGENKELVVDSDHNNEEDFERLLNMSEEWPDDDALPTPRLSSNRIVEEGERIHDVLANLEADSQTLHEYLLDQFHFFRLADELREFGEYLIQNLDRDGRLQGTLAEIVQVYEVSYGRQIAYETAQRVLALIQKLDPPGVGARDLRECLLLQIPADLEDRDILINLISSHLEDIAENRLPVIQRTTGYSLETIKNAVQQLRSFDPHPGRRFEYQPVQNVTPDLVVEVDDSGSYAVRLIDEHIPRLRISKRYRELLRGGADSNTREYIKKKIDSAKWLIESIEQRYGTLKRVAQAIVDHQTEFLEKGPEHIAPLKMQQIADVVGVHVTTVSRAVDDKWVQTPRGLFPLKRFFGGGTKTAEGDDVAWGIIQLKLKELVANEDKSNPLSDDALVVEMGKLGYTLARRTVTKYRKKLEIPSSRLRREY